MNALIVWLFRLLNPGKENSSKIRNVEKELAKQLNIESSNFRLIKKTTQKYKN